MRARVFFFLCKHRSNGALLWQWHLKPNSVHVQYVFAFMFYFPILCFLCILFISINAKEMCRPAETLGLKWKAGIKTQHTHIHVQGMRERKEAKGRVLFRTFEYVILPPLWASPLTKPGIRCVWARVCLCVLDMLGCECAHVQCVPWPTPIRSVLLSAVVATGCETMLVSFSPAFHQSTLPHRMIFCFGLNWLKMTR